MANKSKPIRWTLFAAAQEFNLDRKTLDKQLRAAGITAGDDYCFSTGDICRAVFGDLKGDLMRAQTRQANESADLTAVKKANLQRENIPAALVQRVWSAALVDIRQKVSYSGLTDHEKAELLHDLQGLDVEKYFTDAKAADEEEEEG